jgi:RimJ/RimL family protein N-acetyltransferase
VDFEYTTDSKLVKSIVTHPRIWPHVTDDFSPNVEAYVPPQAGIYLLVKDGDETLGLFFLHPHNAICWEIHTCLLPNAWGQRAKQVVKEAAPWIFAHTGCKRIITNVPDYNRLALRLAKEAGMEQFGVNEKSFQKKGQLHDQIMLGLSKD